MVGVNGWVTSSEGDGHEITASLVSNFVHNRCDRRARFCPKLPMVRPICGLRQSELRIHDLCSMHGVALWQWRGLQSESAVRARDSGAAPARRALTPPLFTI